MLYFWCLIISIGFIITMLKICVKVLIDDNTDNRKTKTHEEVLSPTTTQSSITSALVNSFLQESLDLNILQDDINRRFADGDTSKEIHHNQLVIDKKRIDLIDRGVSVGFICPSQVKA